MNSISRNIVSQPIDGMPEGSGLNTYDAAGRRTRYFEERMGRYNGYLNMVQEHVTEYDFDGDGRPIVEKDNQRTYHQNSPPSGELEAVPQVYQIWSSVLGTNLVTLGGTAGGGTKIFVGGAVIGYFSSSAGSRWTTADPVTGTTVRWTGSNGAWEKETEQTEPLGQMISNYDPDLEGDPTYETAARNAGFPQWQCSLPDSFWGENPEDRFQAMPFECQMRVLQDLSAGLDEIYGFSNPSREPKPEAIGEASPVIIASVFDYVRTDILSSSRKRKKQDGDDCTITLDDGTEIRGKVVGGLCVPNNIREDVLIPINPVEAPVLWKSYRQTSPYGSPTVELRRSDEQYREPPLVLPPTRPSTPKPGDDGDKSTLDLNVGGALGVGAQLGIQVNDRFLSIYTGALFGYGVTASATGSKSLPSTGLNYNGSVTLPPPIPASGTFSGPLNLNSQDVLGDAWKNGTKGGGAAFGAGVMGGITRAWRLRFKCN